MLRAGLMQMVTRPDWTLLSLAVYLASPVIWVLDIRFGVSYLPLINLPLNNLLLSALILSGGVIAYLRSQTVWQKALCLQVGLILAPTTVDIVSWIFYSDPLRWIHLGPLPPMTIAGIYAAFGLPWLGLMFTPALIVPLRRVMAPARTASRMADRPRAPDQKASALWGTWLSWVAATAAGWAAPAPFTDTFRILLFVIVPGLFQWLILRRHVREAGLWVIASAAGLGCGVAWGLSIGWRELYFPAIHVDVPQHYNLDGLLSISAIGAIVGLFQWLVLRSRVEHAHGWVLGNMLIWPAAVATLGLISSALNIPADPWTGFLVLGVVIGALTGLLLTWLLRHPRSNPTTPAIPILSNETA